MSQRHWLYQKWTLSYLSQCIFVSNATTMKSHLLHSHCKDIFINDVKATTSTINKYHMDELLDELTFVIWIVFRDICYFCFSYYCHCYCCFVNASSVSCHQERLGCYWYFLPFIFIVSKETSLYDKYNDSSLYRIITKRYYLHYLSFEK